MNDLVIDVISSLTYSGVFGRKENFLKRYDDNKLREIFPRKPSFPNLKKYYSSDEYAAKLLREMQDIFCLSNNAKEFIKILSYLSGYRPLRILCYGGQYGFLPFLLKDGHRIDCMDFPHRIFEVFKKEYGNKINFIPFEDYLGPDDLYDVIIAFDVLKHDLSPGKIIQKFEECLDIGGLLYISEDNIENNFEHLNNFNFYQIYCATIAHNFVRLLRFNENVYIKSASLSGVKRFRYTDRHIVGSIQKEIFLNTINSLIQPEKCLVIDGPQGEFLKQSISVEITGKPNILASGEDLPIKDNSFDLVYSCHSLEHMQDTRKTLREWIRVLKPGGLLVIIVPDVDYFVHSKKIKLGETCYEEHSAKEYKRIFEEIENTTLLQFDTRKNDFDIDIILRKYK